ncbi:MAG: family 78 glycoside hydrolase catalytic domain [Opitutaceae bacterium]|nr:family 78 glycoside hydrolase catalytic domain [Opitutaceae bacterium]
MRPGLLGLLLMAFAVLPAMAAPALRVSHPRCESAVDPAGVDVTAPRLSWQVVSAERGQRQTAWQVRAASSTALLLAGTPDLWDTGKVSGSETLHQPYDGRPLQSSQTVHWQVRAWDVRDEPSAWSDPARWTMGILTEADWQARWIRSPVPGHNPLFRRSFQAWPGLRRALVHVCGLGHYELRINGVKAGDEVLSPGWTQYRDTTLYETRDVTSLVAAGENVIGVILGNGMFHVERPAGRFAKFVGSHGALRVIAQLRLEYADGTVEWVGTDPDWRTREGPIVFSSIYGGEDYDARRNPTGWDLPGYEARDWTPAVVVDDASLATLKGHSRSAEPVRPIETRAPTRVRELGPGAVLYDFGQNASFMPRLVVSGPAGSTVRLTPGELVQADGTIHRGTMGGAERGSAWWQYTKATDGAETWFPQFYYIGSRYVYAELLPAGPAGGDGTRPRIDRLEMVIVHSAARPVGHFASSDPMLGRIRDLVRWAQRSNMVSILTDCPHREKLGWLEQNHLNGPSLRYEFDLTRLASKNIHDMADAQTPEGLVPNIAPEYTVFRGAFRSAAEWGAAFIHVPWQQYLFTGDRALLQEHYAAMTRYFSYLESRASDGVLAEGLGDWYDHVLGTPGRAKLTPPNVTATAFFFQDAEVLADIAGVLGRSADEERYRRRAVEIRQAFRRAFVEGRAPGQLGSGSQTSLALALAMGLLEGSERPSVLAALIRDLETRGHATSGAAGFRSLLQALVQHDRSDLIHWLATQDSKPGYAFQVKQGGTTLAESWSAQSGASQNHFFLGQIIEWFYKDVAGIRPDPAAPGFKRMFIRPDPVPALIWAEATYDSVRGHVAVRWERSEGGLQLEVSIPANTEAVVQLPSRAGAEILEGGAPAREQPGIRHLGREGERELFSIGSGTYAFVVRP